ncbi:hypothetical protein PIB30_115931, partial [Stylosanthes scabra]|nr:hypothetical protein [Stylosanthes scabra]
MAEIGKYRVPFSTAFMHSDRFVVMCPHRRPSSQCCNHRLLRNRAAHARISGRSLSSAS